jgi:deoxyxylulose-5-phosphate synthase
MQKGKCICKNTIQGKYRPNGPKSFQSNQELTDTIEEYCKYEATSMEEIACTYGYPIDNSDVSQIQDMLEAFYGMKSFNEYNIGSCDVSNVTNMGEMFSRAESFNQHFGSWDVSNVRVMQNMFRRASVFDQDIGSSNVS